MIDIIKKGNRTEYYKDGRLHRDDGPAVICGNGISYWYRNGKMHRDGGPAADWGDGDHSWYRNGVYHREDGPAVDWNGEQKWYIDGVKATPEKPFLKLLIDFKIYDKRIDALVKEYFNDEEERAKLDRLT